jgi:hypothetical protein
MLHRIRGEGEERRGRGRRGSNNSNPLHLLPAYFSFCINDHHHHACSFKVLRPVAHSRHDIYSAAQFPPRSPHKSSPVPQGSCNSLWSKYQDLQCVEDCDTDHPVFYEQPVWQTLQMFGTSFSSASRIPVPNEQCATAGEMLCKYPRTLV